MRDGTARTTELVKGLRAFSRVDEAEFKQADLNASIDSSLMLLGYALGDRIQIVRHYDTIPPVACFASQLNQVIMNILSNAIAAISGSGTITVSTGVSDGQVRISIADTGCGMTDAVKARLFEPFFTTKDVGEGTGLGLSISHGIIERHGGSIDVHSEPGRGSEFIIRIPFSVKEP